MTMINEMLKESTQMMEMLKNALINPTFKLDLEIFDRAITLQQNQIKIVNTAISAYAVHSKNRRALVGLKNMNIMDDTVALEILPIDPDSEKVKCPLFDNLISRNECLDYSGSNPIDCNGCKIGKSTRKKLLSKNSAVYV